MNINLQFLRQIIGLNLRTADENVHELAYAISAIGHIRVAIQPLVLTTGQMIAILKICDAAERQATDGICDLLNLPVQETSRCPYERIRDYLYGKNDRPTLGRHHVPYVSLGSDQVMRIGQICRLLKQRASETQSTHINNEPLTVFEFHPDDLLCPVQNEASIPREIRDAIDNLIFNNKH